MATIFRDPIAVQRRVVPVGLATLCSQQQVTADRLVNLLTGKDQFFAAPGEAPRYDYPNPRGRPFPMDLRGFLNPAEVHLIGKDKFFAAAGEAPRYDCPNPQQVRRAVQPEPTPNLLATTLITAPKPFGMLDWSNPRVRTRFHVSLMLSSGANLLETTLGGVAGGHYYYRFVAGMGG